MKPELVIQLVSLAITVVVLLIAVGNKSGFRRGKAQTTAQVTKEELEELETSLSKLRHDYNNWKNTLPYEYVLRRDFKDRMDIFERDIRENTRRLDSFLGHGQN